MTNITTKIYHDSMKSVKVGDMIWYKDSDDTDEGVVHQIDGDKVWANWTNTGISEFVLISNSDGYSIKQDGGRYSCGKLEIIDSNTENLHPRYSIIVNWASGKKIQRKRKGQHDWEDWDFGFDVTPDFSVERNIMARPIRFRIKPKVTKYRLGLNDKNEITVYYSTPSNDDTSFKKWIDANWKELEVVGD